MDILKFAAQRKAGIDMPMLKVGPATVTIAQPKFCENTGAQLESAPMQVNLVLIDDHIAKMQAERDKIDEAMTEMAAFRVLVADKLK